MCDKELLVSYIYDDIIAWTARGSSGTCASARRAARKRSRMRSVRDDLAAWDAAAADDRASASCRDRKPSWRAWWTPAFGLAAAAVLVLAAASAIANVEVHYGPNGLAVRTGWTRPQAVGPRRESRRRSLHSRRARGSVQPRRGDARGDQPAPHGARVRRMRDGGARGRCRRPRAHPADDAEILRRVSDLVAQSETRQQQELALRIAQLIRDVDAQRVADLMRIQQGQGGSRR